jgi:hypothetical protein
LINNRNVLLTALEVKKFKIKVSADSVLGEGLHLLAEPTHSQRGKQVFLDFFSKDINTIHNGGAPMS